MNVTNLSLRLLPDNLFLVQPVTGKECERGYQSGRHFEALTRLLFIDNFVPSVQDRLRFREHNRGGSMPAICSLNAITATKSRLEVPAPSLNCDGVILYWYNIIND